MFKVRNQATKNSLLLLFIIGIIAFLVWGNLQFIKQNPGGNDFLVNWVGTQSLIKENISPYSDTVALRIQNEVYEKPPINGMDNDLRVKYPLYSAFLFLPFSLISDFELARAFWMVFLEISLLFTVILSLKISDWQPNNLMIFLLMVFGIFWYHGLRPLIDGNAVILISFCVVFVLFSIKQKQDELAGIVLALTTIHPQIVLAFIIVTVFWAIINRRWRIIFWFFGTIILLFILSLFFMPNWIIQYLQEIVRDPGLVNPQTPAQALAVLLPGTGYRMGLLLSGLSGLIILVEMILGRDAKGVSLVWVACISLVLGQWINIKTDPVYFLVMLPALIIALKMIEERWVKFGFWVNLGILLFLFIVPWWIFARMTIYGNNVIESPLLFFVSPAILVILLYWVRWWTKYPIKHTLES